MDIIKGSKYAHFVNSQISSNGATFLGRSYSNQNNKLTIFCMASFYFALISVKHLSIFLSFFWWEPLFLPFWHLRKVATRRRFQNGGHATKTMITKSYSFNEHDSTEKYVSACSTRGLSVCLWKNRTTSASRDNLANDFCPFLIFFAGLVCFKFELVIKEKTCPRHKNSKIKTVREKKVV